MGIEWADEHKYSEETRFIAWIVVITICWIDGIILLIGYRHFRRLSHLMIIQKRYPQIVLFESTLGWMLSFILVPFLYTTYIELELFSDYQWYIDRFTFCVYPFAHFIVGCEVYRLWLICFDLNYLHHTRSTEWQSQIDDSRTADSHWWTQQANRATFGNPKWLRNRVIAWCLFAGLTPSIIYQIWDWTPWTQIFDAFFYAAPILFELGSFYMCPSIADTFMFMFEFKTTSFIFVTGLGGYLVGMLLMFFDLFIAQTVMALSGQWGLSVVSIISTIFIPYRITHSEIWHRELHRQSTGSTFSRSMSYTRSRSDTRGSSIRSTSPSTSPPPQGSSAAGSGEKGRKRSKSKSNSGRRRGRRREENYVARLKAILLKEETFGQFVHWMYGEFSSESILSFIEFVQFKQRAIEVLKEHPDFPVDPSDLVCAYSFYSKVPKSSIVFKTVTEYGSSQSMPNDHDPEISQMELSPMSAATITATMMNSTTPISPRPSFLFKMSSLLHSHPLKSLDEQKPQTPTASIEHHKGHLPQSTPSNGPSPRPSHSINSMQSMPPKLGLKWHPSSSHGHGPSSGHREATPTEGSVGTHTNEHPPNDLCIDLEYEGGGMVDPRVMALRAAAAKLHHKYLMICAEFEVNISAASRRGFYELDAKHWDLDAKELVHLFDDVTECMFSYMKQSYLRFEKSQQ